MLAQRGRHLLCPLSDVSPSRIGEWVSKGRTQDCAGQRFCSHLTDRETETSAQLRSVWVEIQGSPQAAPAPGKVARLPAQ